MTDGKTKLIIIDDFCEPVMKRALKPWLRKALFDKIAESIKTPFHEEDLYESLPGLRNETKT